MFEPITEAYSAEVLPVIETFSIIEENSTLMGILFITFAVKNDVAPKVNMFALLPVSRKPARASVIPNLSQASTSANMESTKGITSSGARLRVLEMIGYFVEVMNRYSIVTSSRLMQNPNAIIHMGRLMYEPMLSSTMHPIR